MDGTLAIEANREALKRIVAMLVDMAGLAEPAPEADKLAEASPNPLTASLRSAPLPLKGGEEARTPSPPPSAFPHGTGEGAGVTPSPLPLKGGVEGAATSPLRSPLFVETGEKAGAPSPPRSPLPPRSGERWPAKRVGEGVDFTRDELSQLGASERQGRTLPRLLWRAILALLRPAESAARRLIIAASAGITVPAPAPRQPKPPTMEPLLRKLGIAVMMPPGGLSAVAQRAKADGGRAPAHRLTFPLFDPPRRLALYGQHRRHVPAHAVPRIWCPGLTDPAPLPPPPSPDDLVNAAHVGRRIAALSKALDDLPDQARRFARLKASREAVLDRSVFPIRRTRPPGGRLIRYDPNAAHPPRIREVDEILAHAHSLALYALENPDTS